MNNLRLTLKVLFSGIDAENVLASLFQFASKSAGSSRVDQDVFVRLFCEHDSSYSLEQARAVLGGVKTDWMQPNKQHPGLRYSSQESVFNVILAFCSDVLSMQEVNPVCHYNRLMRWNNLTLNLGEDMLTTAFLAARDLANGSERHSFTWEPIIRHDNSTLNECLYSKPLADLHFHLKGSSQIFLLNWLSLMNSISGRGTQFERIGNYLARHIQLYDGCAFTSLYLCAIKACAIRYLLFMQLVCTDKKILMEQSDENLVMDILRCRTVEEAHIFLPELDNRIQSCGYCMAKRYGETVVDYAIPATMTIPDTDDEHRYLLTLLSGERQLLYKTYRYIYSGKYAGTHYPELFYAYLLFKNRLRGEFIQVNNKVGFENFQIYQSRKEVFINRGSVYDTLIPRLAVSTFLNVGVKRYLEARIAPKDTSGKLANAISRLDRDIYDPRFSPHYIGRRNDQENKNYKYILHFIKSRDASSDKTAASLMPRHYELRDKVRREAQAIADLWQSTDERADRIAGIDAASSEILCRPEVFGQAFRFLRECRPNHELEYWFTWNRTRLGITYHVGESFLDIVDGLRAIDETCIFLNLQRHDRIGHALALGVDVNAFYGNKCFTVVMPKQVFLDNIVWLYHKAGKFGLPEADRLRYWFMQQYEQLFSEIYKPDTASESISIYDYYLSWLLRGDNPELYSYGRNDKNKNVTDWYTEWDRYACCQTSAWRDELEQARGRSRAVNLYSRYHFDPVVKAEGAKSSEFKLDESFVELVALVQRKMMAEIVRMGICIETNPTSNYLIDRMPRYDCHPIYRFYNPGLNLSYEKCSIPVSINTDDLGVFSTSIEREYSLVAWAVEKWSQKSGCAYNVAPMDIYRWLDQVRAMSCEQIFDFSRYDR